MNQRSIPAVRDQEYEDALDALATIYAAKRRPIIFVGSGLSTIYGAPLWNEAVGEVLDQTIHRIETTLKAKATETRPRAIAALEHFRAKLKVFVALKQEGAAEDRFAALEIAQQALDLCNVIDPRGTPRNTNAILAEAVTSARCRYEMLLKALGFKDLAAERLPHAGGYRRILAHLFDTKWIKRHLKRHPLLDRLGGSPPRIDQYYLLLPLLETIQNAGGDVVRKRLVGLLGDEKKGGLLLPEGFDPRPSVDPIRRLRDHFDVRRFITLNYDLELERALMFPDALNRSGGGEALNEFADLFSEQDNGRVARRMPDGTYVVSDVYSPRNAARLFEFSLNAPSQTIQILHLHGRADDPTGMVARDPDYARQYIQGSSNPQALRLALNVALCGNPVFFVGVGLSEPEVMDILRRSKVEDASEPRNPPFAFVLSEEADDTLSGTDWRVQVRNKLLYRVNVIHAGHARDGEPALPQQIKVLNGWFETSSPDGSAGLEWEAAALDGISRFTSRELRSAFLHGATTRLKTHALDQKIVRLASEVEKLVIGGSRYAPVQCYGFERINKDPDRPIRHVIGTIKTSGSAANGFKLADDKNFTPSHAFEKPVTLVVGPPLAGKGSLAREILNYYCQNTPRGDYLSINIGVVLEIDSVVTAIYAFLNTLGGGRYTDETDRLTRIGALLSTRLERPGLILMSGVERLFTAKGRCIAPDFEHLLLLLFSDARRSASGPQVIVISSLNIEPWIAQLRLRKKGQAASGPHVLKLSSAPRVINARGQAGPVGIAAAFEEQINQLGLDRQQHALISVQRSIAMTRTGHEAQARAMLGMVLEHWPEDEDRALAMALLRTMAAIGAPTTPRVLSHAPSVRSALTTKGPVDVGKVRQGLQRLKDRSLISEFVGGRATWRRSRSKPVKASFHVRTIVANSHDRVAGQDGGIARLPSSASDLEAAPDPGPPHEWCLHRLVLDEMRTRLGIPMGAEPMSNTFSLSIAASLPVSVTVPDDDMRDKLSELFSHLRGAWNDVQLSDEASALLADLAKELKIRHDDPKVTDASVTKASASANLSSLHQLARALAMLETPMAANLRAASDLLRSFFSATTLVMQDPPITPNRESPFVSHKRRIRKLFSSVRRHETLRSHLAQIAKRLNLNRSYIKRLSGIAAKHRANTDEISLNSGELIWLHNERGVISLLEGDLYEAEFSLSKALEILTETRGRVRGHNRNRIDLNRCILMIERGQLAETRVLLDEIQRHIDDSKSAESAFIEPVALGYRAMVAQLNGRTEEAQEHYERAIKGLVKTEQLRALGLVQMRRGGLWRAMGRSDEARLDFEAAVRSGEACSQLDVMWRAKLCLANEGLDAGKTDTIARDALAFADRLGLHRVAVEALRVSARACFMNGDLDEAGQLIARAMSIASSCGMTLRRISLRADMGAILIKQGDRNGEWLIRRSIAYAERIQYQSGVQNAQHVLQIVQH